jgi:nicotinamidase-related amidase
MTSPTRALVLVDVQLQYVDGPLEIRFPPHAESIPRIAAAIDAATAAGLPIVVVQHDGGVGSPVFDPETPEFALHPEVERRRTTEWKAVTKQYGSVFAGTDVRAWLRERGVDTVTLVGYMTNNCIIASAAEAEPLGLTAEVLSDATGAIDIANAAGSAGARSVHETLMALLHSNFAAVATTDAWMDAVSAGRSLAPDNLIESAARGAERHPRA